MEWIKTTDRLPPREEGASYSQVPCLVRKRIEWTRGENSGVYWNTQILQFNHEHNCWDQEDGDDFDCDVYRVDYWMPLPEPPKQ